MFMRSSIGLLALVGAACVNTRLPQKTAVVAQAVPAADSPSQDLRSRGITSFPYMDTAWFRVWIADNDDKAQRWPIGYNGIAALVPHHSGANIFVPYFSGLNYETIEMAGLGKYPETFEPRKEPMSIASASATEVVLVQPETSHGHVSATITFRVEEPWYVHQSIELVFHKRFVSESEKQTFGSLFASYMFLPDDPVLYVRPEGQNGDPLTGWFGTRKLQHDSEHYTVTPLPSDRTLSVADHAATLETAQPLPDDGAIAGDLALYYGHLFDGMVMVQMFKQPELFRFAYSPSGGYKANAGDGKGMITNPAWDYRIALDDVELGKPYRFDTCIAVKPFRGRADVVAEYKRYRARD